MTTIEHAEQVPYLTLGRIAELYGVTLWQVRRLFERGLLPEPPRMGQYRVVAESDLPAIESALREAGYLPVGEKP